MVGYYPCSVPHVKRPFFARQAVYLPQWTGMYTEVMTAEGQAALRSGKLPFAFMRPLVFRKLYPDTSSSSVCPSS